MEKFGLPGLVFTALLLALPYQTESYCIYKGLASHDIWSKVLKKQCNSGGPVQVWKDDAHVYWGPYEWKDYSCSDDYFFSEQVALSCTKSCMDRNCIRHCSTELDYLYKKWGYNADAYKKSKIAGLVNSALACPDMKCLKQVCWLHDGKTSGGSICKCYEGCENARRAKECKRGCCLFFDNKAEGCTSTIYRNCNPDNVVGKEWIEKLYTLLHSQ